MAAEAYSITFSGHGMIKGSFKLISVFVVASSLVYRGLIRSSIVSYVDFPNVQTNYSALSGTPEAIYKTIGQCNLHKNITT